MSVAEISRPPEYRELQRYPGYRFGDDGSIWSSWRQRPLPGKRGTASYRSDRWRRLKCNPCRDGYARAELKTETGAGETALAHRVILEAFVGPCPAGMECCHADGDRKNNRLDNLRWDTSVANEADRVRHGKAPYGPKHYLTKLGRADVDAMRGARRAGARLKELAARYGLSVSAVSKICTGRNWAVAEGVS